LIPRAVLKISYNKNCPEIIAEAHIHLLPSPRNRLPAPSFSIIVATVDNPIEPFSLLFFATYVNTESAGWLTTDDKAPLKAPAARVTPNEVIVASLRKGHVIKKASQHLSNAKNLILPKITCRIKSDGRPAYNDFQPIVASSSATTCNVPLNPISRYTSGSDTVLILHASNGAKPMLATTAAVAPAINTTKSRCAVAYALVSTS
jgi:hypothetical protein